MWGFGDTGLGMNPTGLWLDARAACAVNNAQQLSTLVAPPPPPNKYDDVLLLHICVNICYYQLSTLAILVVV